MKKGLMIILTILLTGGAFYSGMTYFLLEQESEEIKEIVVGDKTGNVGETPKIKRILYIPNKNFSSLERKEIESPMGTDRNKQVKELYNLFFQKIKEGTDDFSQPELLNIYWNDRDLYINLGRTESLMKDQNRALIVLYGITNSITEIGGINRIKFILDGRETGGVFSSYYERNLKI